MISSQFLKPMVNAPRHRSETLAIGDVNGCGCVILEAEHKELHAFLVARTDSH